MTRIDVLQAEQRLIAEKLEYIIKNHNLIQNKKAFSVDYEQLL